MSSPIITEQIDTIDRFNNYIIGNEISNILLGNGFSLSHPEYGPRLHWDLDKALLSKWDVLKPNAGNNCPEKDLNTIRLRMLRFILEYYLNNLFNDKNPYDEERKINELYSQYTESSFECHLPFLNNQFGKIITINYDPIMYFELLRSTSNIIDGFVSNDTSDFLTQKHVCDHLENSNNKTQVLYLHGSWFLQQNNSENENIRKMSFSYRSSTTTKNIISSSQYPLLILEDRWQTKEALINECEYFRFCFDALKKINSNILLFGCSLRNDAHIIKAIDAIEDGINIYITYLNSDSAFPKKIKSMFKRKNPTFIPICTNVIWAQKS